MIDPNNLLHIENTEQRKTENQLQVLEINSIEEDEEPLYDIYNNKDFKKYITDIEKEVRSSFEYQRAIQYIKNYMGANKSPFMEGVNNKDYEKVKIELHHSPFTLFDIALIVFYKRRYYGESIEVEPVAKEVAKLHYYLVVGLVSLTKTEHQLVHNNYLFVPSTKVLGDYGKFISYYEQFMSPEQKEIIERIEEYSLNYNQAQNEIVLQNNLITLNTEKVYELPDFGKLKLAMETNADKIKSNGYQLLSIEEQRQQEEYSNTKIYNNIDNYNADINSEYEYSNCVRFRSKK